MGWNRLGAAVAARRIALAASMLVWLGGCSASFRGEPVNPFSVGATATTGVVTNEERTETLGADGKVTSVTTRKSSRLDTSGARRGGGMLSDGPAVTPPAWLTDFAILQDGASFTKTRRNEIVAARMYLLDIAYGEFEGKLLAEVNQSGFSASLASLILTTGATAVSDADTKTALAALATVINGGRTAFSKEMLAEQTVQTLIGFMQARRAEIKTQLIERMKLSAGDWPMGLALSDLQGYYRAGTLTGAMLAAAESAATNRKDADAETDTLLSYDQRETDQAVVAKAIGDCFARVPAGQFDAVVQDAAAQDLLGLGQQGADTLKALTDTSIRQGNPPVPTAGQKSIYLDLIENPVGSEAGRKDRLAKHQQAVCRLAQ